MSESSSSITRPTEATLQHAIQKGTVSLAVLTDGKWEPAKDIPAAWKLAQAASVTLAAAAFGIHELLELATSLGLL